MNVFYIPTKCHEDLVVTMGVGPSFILLIFTRFRRRLEINSAFPLSDEGCARLYVAFCLHFQPLLTDSSRVRQGRSELTLCSAARVL